CPSVHTPLEIIKAAADFVLSNVEEEEGTLHEPYAYMKVGEGTLLPRSLFYSIHDINPDNDPFILDVRTSDFYAKGHVPGAINIPADEVFEKSNLKKLPPHQQIVVVGYMGCGIEAQVTGWLNALGYDA
ncbi:unnamed protein product, partial [marine sediment metagenome]